MTRAARIAAFFLAVACRLQLSGCQISFGSIRHRRLRSLSLVGLASLLCPDMCWRAIRLPRLPRDKTMQDSAGHSISVDGEKFSASIHGSLQCNNCHADIKEYPHPDHIAKVDCKTCHADEGFKTRRQCALIFERASLHELSWQCARDLSQRLIRDRQCTRSIFRRPAASATATAPWPRRKGLPSVYPHYMDSIHGFALSKEGLLVAANCQSCHGSHGILSHKDPNSPTFKANIPKTCGTCHAKINDDYQDGAHGHARCQRQI